MSRCCITVTSTQRQVIIIAFTFVVFALNHFEPPYQELLVSLLWNTPNEQQQFGTIWCFLWNTAQSLLTARFKNNVLRNIPINGGAMFCKECDLLLNKEVKLWPTAEDRVAATSVDSGASSSEQFGSPRAVYFHSSICFLYSLLSRGPFIFLWNLTTGSDWFFFSLTQLRLPAGIINTDTLPFMLFVSES